MQDAVFNAMVIEEQLFRAINSLAGQSLLVDDMMTFISSGTTWTVVGLLAMIVVLSSKREKFIAVFLAAILALALADWISFRIVKPLVGRERPCWLLDHVHMVVNQCGGSFGFTSNHAANAFAVWSMIALAFGTRSRMSLAAVTLATLVALSRVYLGVHFVGDILGGAILGTMVALLAHRLGLLIWSTKVSKLILNYFASSGK